jgi:hypothetical protein
MKIGRDALIYTIIISLFSLLIWQLLERGDILEDGKLIAAAAVEDNGVKAVQENANVFSIFQREFLNNLKHPLAIFIIQLVIIISVSKQAAIGSGRNCSRYSAGPFTGRDVFS